MRRLWVLAALVVAGCVSPVEAPPDGQSAALDHRDLALSAARAWAPDAELVAVAAGESAEAGEPFGGDPRVGDGRAPGWGYVFRAEGGVVRTYGVSADGVVERWVEAERIGDGLAAARPVGEWTFDSEAALAKSRESPDVAEALDREGANVGILLAYDMEDAPCWYVVVGGGSPEAAAMVDALDGRLVSAGRWGSHGFDVPGMATKWVDFGTPVHLEGEASLAGPEAASEHAFRLDRAGQEGYLRIVGFQALPTQTLLWSVLDDAGEAVASGEVPGANADDFDFAFTMPDRGNHVLRFGMADAAPTTVRPLDFSFTFDASWMQMDVDA